MAKPTKPDTTTGNGFTPTPILASGKDPTEGQSKPSPNATSIESGSTKPLSQTEALSLFQTSCHDLVGMGWGVSILAASNNRLFVRLFPPPDTGEVGFAKGHITLNGTPVSV